MNKNPASRFFIIRRSIYHLPLALSLALLRLAPHPALAAIRTVTNLNDSGAGSLRADEGGSADIRQYPAKYIGSILHYGCFITYTVSVRNRT